MAFVDFALKDISAINPEVMLPKLTAWERTFITDMLHKFKKYGDKIQLSPKQAHWLGKIHGKLVSEEVEPPKTVAVAGLEKVVAMLHTALFSMKFPKVCIKVNEHATVKFSVSGGRSAAPGSINVSNSYKYGHPEHKYYGRISVDGTWPVGPEVPLAVVKAVQAFAQDPMSAAKAYGMKYGHCCFCAKELTTTESVTAGYGPVCAAAFGLPWGAPGEFEMEEMVAKAEKLAEEKAFSNDPF